ncbi:caa(3)-type oxidase subunit IV [Salinisphaera aquimarina]|uniref:Caa(3)-type oxidase subunit IV n=1 Tax=Salinisphaera aquimarina TaxID=2094031 RepID=A0ABV7ELL2_9GAMM
MNFLRANSLLIAAFAALLMLLIFNIGVAFMPLPGFRTVLHLGSAVLMAIIIAGIFMDLRSAGALMRVFALGGLLWLAFMWLLFPVDYFTR